MSKISEVLLGSVTPFQLLAGKLLGVVGRLVAAGVRLPRGRRSTRSLRLGRADLIDPALIALVPAVPRLRGADVRIDLPRARLGVLRPEGRAEHAAAGDDARACSRTSRRSSCMRAPDSTLAVGMSFVPDDDAVRDDAADGRCRRARRSGRSRSSVAILVAIDAALRLGGRPHLPRRPADAGQGAEPAGAVEMGQEIVLGARQVPVPTRR